MRVLAPAKINLYLDVCKRRGDGFHDIDTVFRTVSLCDIIDIWLIPAGINLDVSGPFSDALPRPGENLIVKAINYICDEYHYKTGISVRLNKNIPLGAGLGGGSSDAAAVIRTLPKLIKKKMPHNKALAIAKMIGSDVPFFLTGGCARGTGRGDLIEPIRDKTSYFAVLIYPFLNCSTARIYTNLTMKKTLTNNENINNIIKSLQTGKQLNIWGKFLYNRLEDSAFSLYPEIKNIKTLLHKAGAEFSLMSGSGSVVYTITDSYAQALKIKREFLQISHAIKSHIWIVHPEKNS
ncbi:MAG: 4-(cytidine 5'-diphospho)-2-C-methyl-D-erythritol kinase [bacterium]